MFSATWRYYRKAYDAIEEEGLKPILWVEASVAEPVKTAAVATAPAAHNVAVNIGGRRPG